ncbi:abortive infection family protein [Streptomyces sp. NPDC060035]|uniref:abortive infection family protein n=1 Tax=Streptomyces sp. NPDC060035 TaxID=3347044 RepID=UPI0036995863
MSSAAGFRVPSPLWLSPLPRRNAGFGTGHGLSRRPELKVPTARMVVDAAVTVAHFYLDVHAAASSLREGEVPGRH